MNSSSSETKSRSRLRRFLLLIPLFAVGVIAPLACYDEYGGYGYGAPSAVPYGARPARVAAPVYIESRNYGYSGSRSYERNREYSRYRGGHYGHSNYGEQKEYQRRLQRSREEAVEASKTGSRSTRGVPEGTQERRKESGNEGWKFEERNEER